MADLPVNSNPHVGVRRPVDFFYDGARDLLVIIWNGKGRIEMPPGDARRLAEKLIDCCDRLDGKSDA